MMSSFATPSNEFEKDFRKRFLPLSKRLSVLEGKLQRMLRQSILNPERSTVFWNALRRDMTAIYKEMNVVYSSWAKTEIKGRYGRSLQKMFARIESSKSVINSAQKGFLELLNGRASTQIVSSLYLSSVDSFLSSTVIGRKNMFHLTRLTQQTLVQEALIDITVATGFDLGDLRKASRALSGQLWGELWEAAKNERFVQAGKMKYKPSDYAEMVARTKFHEAQSNAALMTAANYDTDLIQVSSHNTTTAICIPFEGLIFSISGKSKMFPPLTDSSPYHPNCLHLMYPAFESAMIAQGTLESFSAFSKGKISRPPIPASFIPVDKRKIA